MADLSDDELARIWAALCPERWPITEAGKALARAAIAADRALNAPQAAPVAQAERAGWVSVSDRLPEKNTEVLIAFAGQNTLCSTGQYTGGPKDVHGWCYPWENRGATDEGDDPIVTHWMPLPAAPTPDQTKG